jgi:hypothetical protein
MMKPETTSGAAHESKALPALAQIAVRELNKNMNTAMDEIITESMTVLGLTPDKWQFNLQTMQFDPKQ